MPRHVRSAIVTATACGAASLLICTAQAADLAGKCCDDLEARIAELESTVVRHGLRSRPGAAFELKIHGVINNALLGWDDGGRRDVFVVGSQQSGSGFEIEGETKLANGWKIGFTIGFDTLNAPSDAVSQSDVTGNSATGGGLQLESRAPGIEIGDASIKFENSKYGVFQFGFQDSASDDIDNMNLSGSNVLANAGVDSWGANFFVRGKGSVGASQLLAVRWGDFFDGNLLGGTVPSISYHSPVLFGFQAAAAWGADDLWDVALRYGKEFGGIRLIAGIGYFVNRTEELGDVEPKEDRGWGGSIAALHIPSGLNLAVNYSEMHHTKNCAEPGAVSGQCRGADRVFYAKGGLIRDLNSFGPTIFHVEYYRQTKDSHESEAPALEALERDPGSALELLRSTGTMWGIGVVQTFNDSEKAEKKGKNGKNGNGNGNGNGKVKEEDEEKKELWGGKKDGAPIELYLGYRRYSLDVDLADNAGGVASKKLNDFSAVLTGMKIRF